MLNVIEMIRGDIMRLCAVSRFNNATRTREESVMEHVGVVCMYATCLARHVDQNAHGIVIDWEILMTRCATHDAEESVSGDFPRSFKYSSDEVRVSLADAGHTAAVAVFDKLGDSGLIRSWSLAKSHDTEGYILKLSDFLSSFAYVWRETLLGNQCIITDTSDIPTNWNDMVADPEMVELFGLEILMPIARKISQLYGSREFDTRNTLKV